LKIRQIGDLLRVPLRWERFSQTSGNLPQEASLAESTKPKSMVVFCGAGMTIPYLNVDYYLSNRTIVDLT
jgi:hypothetical protein